MISVQRQGHKYEKNKQKGISRTQLTCKKQVTRETSPQGQSSLVELGTKPEIRGTRNVSLKTVSWSQRTVPKEIVSLKLFWKMVDNLMEGWTPLMF